MDTIYKIFKDDNAFDLKVIVRSEKDEEVFEMSLEPEDESNNSFKFVGTIINLIDQDKIWKKFEISELLELIKFSYQANDLELIFQDNSAIIIIKVVINNKKTSCPIKMRKSNKKEFTQDELNESILFNLKTLNSQFKKINNNNKTEHISIIFNSSQEYLPYGKKQFPFDFSIKTTSNIDFKFEMELSQLCSQSSWLVVDLMWENKTNGEKGNLLIFNKHFYAPTNTNSGYHNLPTIKSERIQTFKRGEYKFILAIEQKTNASLFYYYLIKLFSKIRN